MLDRHHNHSGTRTTLVGLEPGHEPRLYSVVLDDLSQERGSMPYYEYHCPANGRTIEVRHGMSEHLDTWGGLAERAGIAAGDTPATASVERVMSAPVPLTGASTGPAFGGCGSACGCARGA